MLTFQRFATQPDAAASTHAAAGIETEPTTGARSPGRVLHVVDAQVPGVGRHVLDLTRHLLAEAWAVDVAYAPGGVDDGFADALATIAGLGRIVRLEPGRGLRSARFRTPRTLRRTIRDTDPDIVHGHGLRGGAWSQLGAATARARTVHTPNSLAGRWPDLAPTRRSVYRNLEVGLSPFTDHLIHLSDAEARHSERLGLLPVSCSVIPAGIEPIDVPTREQARAHLGLPSYDRAADPITIGTTGSLERGTDLRVVLDAFAKLAVLTDRPAELVVVGDGPYRAVLTAYGERLADTVGVPGAIRFVGDTDAARAMPAFDVFIGCAADGFPYGLVEALWAGVPCVSVPNPAAEPLLADGVAGRLADAPGSAALAEALARLDDTRRTAMAGAARGRAERFTNAQMVGEVTAIYRRLLRPGTGETSAGDARA